MDTRHATRETQDLHLTLCFVTCTHVRTRPRLVSQDSILDAQHAQEAEAAVREQQETAAAAAEAKRQWDDGRPKKTYAKTLRLTSDQLVSLSQEHRKCTCGRKALPLLLMYSDVFCSIRARFAWPRFSSRRSAALRKWQKSLNLKKGANTITFSVTSSYSGVATCTARIFLWESSHQVVVSDIDGTITK